MYGLQWLTTWPWPTMVCRCAFHLNPAARFSDGSPVLAEDVKASLTPSPATKPPTRATACILPT